MKTLFKIIIGIIVIIVLVSAVFLYLLFAKQSPGTVQETSDYKNLTYVIENKPVVLINGYSEVEAAPGSASKVITQYFGNEAIGDINGDGLPDVAFLLTQDSGGSGTFYYIAAALKNSSGYQSTNTIFLGDRIAPQTTEIHNGVITVNYADRKTGEPMTATPSVGVSKSFKLENNQLIEVTVK